MKPNALKIFGFILIALMSSCDRDDEDILTITQEEPDVTESLVVCEGVQLNISVDNYGNAEAVVGGGQEPYAFLWSTGDTSNAAVLDINDTVVWVQVTDQSGCILQDTLFYDPDTIMEDPCDSLVVLITEETPGILVAQATGGTLPYSYVWSPSEETSREVNVNTPGYYLVTVTDANGCVADRVYYYDHADPCVDFSVWIVESSDGVFTAQLFLGEPPISYLWSTGDTTSSIVPVHGEYTVTATDNLGCTASWTRYFFGPDACVEFKAEIYNPQGYTLIADLTNGYPPFSYTWEPTEETSSSITAPGPGTYYLTVRDSFDCVTMDTIILN